MFKANLLEEGSFDSIIDGCEGVFHTASPFYHDVKDPEVHSISLFFSFYIWIVSIFFLPLLTSHVVVKWFKNLKKFPKVTTLIFSQKGFQILFFEYINVELLVMLHGMFTLSFYFL